ncbi:MAG TPA: FxsA family protein [Candidatus Saccharimonadales bacterium]|nr:FxsA family protein [Candidatus Saccharimonadales bacterium]
MGVLLLLFILVPAVELALLIEIGGRIGALNTLALIVGTGVLGASIARRQGLQVIASVRADLQAGRMPGGAILDGVIILVAGALLVTPGVLTDLAGFLCLVPAVRSLIKQGLVRRFERAIRERRVEVVYGRTPGRDPWGHETSNDPDVIDVDASEPPHEREENAGGGSGR